MLKHKNIFFKTGGFLPYLKKKNLFRACRLDRRESLDEYEPLICDSLDIIISKGVNCKEFSEFSSNETVVAVQKMVSKYARENLAKVSAYL